MAAGPSVNAELTQRYDLQRVRDVSWQKPITLGNGNGQTFDIFSATDLQILPHAVVFRLDDHGAYVTRLGNTVYVRSAPALTLGPAAFGQDRIGFDVPVPLQLPDYQQQHQQHYQQQQHPMCGYPGGAQYDYPSQQGGGYPPPQQAYYGQEDHDQQPPTYGGTYGGTYGCNQRMQSAGYVPVPLQQHNYYHQPPPQQQPPTYGGTYDRPYGDTYGDTYECNQRNIPSSPPWCLQLKLLFHKEAMFAP